MLWACQVGFVEHCGAFAPDPYEPALGWFAGVARQQAAGGEFGFKLIEGDAFRGFCAFGLRGLQDLTPAFS